MGVFFAMPEEWGEAKERGYVAKVAKTLPDGLKLEYEGRYQAMLSHEVKNYALLTYDGKLTMRGVAFRSNRSEPFAVEFLEKAVFCTLTGDIAGLHQLYSATVAKLRAGQFKAAELAVLARLAKSPAGYLKSRGRLKEAAYEAVLASGRLGSGCAFTGRVMAVMFG